MQFSKIVSALALAMTAAAAPTGGDVKSCSTDTHTQYCCNGLANCVDVNVLAILLGGKQCNAESYCCKTDDTTYSAFADISLLNCAKILG